MIAQAQSETAADMAESAAEAAAMLKALAHEARLMILCHLASHGELSVGQLERLLNKRQAAVSQLLSRLRDDELVTTRREGKTVYYALSRGPVQQILAVLKTIYC